MKNYLYILFSLLFFTTKTFAQTAPTFTIKVNGKEVNSVCLGIAPTFTSTGSGSDLSWNFGDGKNGTGTSISNQYTQPGTYSVTLKDNTTGLTSTPKSITINPVPKSSFSVSTTSSCTGTLITFTGTPNSQNPITQYQWDFGNGSGITRPDQSIQFSYNSAGTYTPSLIVTDQNGCSGTSTNNQQIQIGGSDIQASFRTSDNLTYSCDNSISLVNNTNENGKAGVNYFWNFGDNTTDNNKIPNKHTYASPGVYNITLKASYGGNTGCAAGFTKTIYIGKPNISINVPNSICANAIFPLQATSNIPGFVNTPADINWKIDNGTVLNGGTTGYFNNVPGNHTIRVTNINGCPNTSSKSVNVTAAPIFHLSTVPNFGACTETIITYNTALESNNTIPVKSYNWTAGDGTPSTGEVSSSNYIHIFRTAGNYTTTVIATNTSGCSSTQQIPVAVINDCTDYGFGTAYNPIFSFTSLSCDDKYTIVIKNKITSVPIKGWRVDGVTYAAVGEQATIPLILPNPNEKNKKYTVETLYSDGSVMDTKKIGIIDEKANFKFVNTENASKYCANNRFIFNTDTSLNLENISKLTWKILNLGTQETYNVTGNSPSFIFPKPGQYSVELTIYDIRPTPCTSSIVKNIQIDGIAIDFTADSTSFCYTNPTVKLNAQIITSNADISNLYWSTGDGNNITKNGNDYTLTYAYNYMGNNNQAFYDVNLTGIDNNGCKASLKKNDFVKIYSPQVSFAKTDTLLCSSRKIIIQNTSNVPNGDYLWKVGDYTKTYQRRDQFNHTFDNIPNPSTMDVYLKVTDAGGCSKDTLVKNYIRFTKPNSSYDITNKQLLNECPPYTLIFKNLSSNTSSYKWTIMDGDSKIYTYTIEDSLHFTTLHPGKTIVKLDGLLDGCSDSHIDSFVVKGPIAFLKILDTIGCSPFTSRMAVHHNDDVNGYQWNLGDGTTIVSASADSIAHNYKNGGTYIPRVSVSGYEGCTDSLETPSSIIVAHLSPSMESFNTQDKCTFETAKFLNTTPNIAIPIKKYIWNWGHNLKEENGSRDTISHIFPDTSMYIPVSLTAVTDYCTATSDTVIVSPHFSNDLSIAGNSSFCDNDSLNLKGILSHTPDNNNRFIWYNQKDSILQNGSDSILKLPMNYSISNQIKLKIINTFGCVNTVSKDIKMLISPIITLADSLKLCNGDSATLQATADGNFSWTSSSNNIINNTTSNPIIFPKQSTYFYTTVTNLDNCQKKDSIWIDVNNRIGTSFKDNYKSCLSDTALIPIMVKTDLPAQFTWTSLPIDNSISNISTQNILVNPHQKTTYHFVAHSNNVCPDETGEILVEYAPAPTINFSSKTIMQPAGTIFTITPDILDLTPGTRFTWSPDVRIENRFVLNPTIIADKDITYTLSLLDSYGCTTIASVQVKVLCNTSKILMANAFTPNGDGKNDRFYVSGYGIKNVSHFTIIDRWGKKVFEKNNMTANDINAGWDGTVNGKPCETGTYLYFGELECTEGNKIPVKGSVLLIR